MKIPTSAAEFIQNIENDKNCYTKIKIKNNSSKNIFELLNSISDPVLFDEIISCVGIVGYQSRSSRV